MEYTVIAVIVAAVLVMCIIAGKVLRVAFKLILAGLLVVALMMSILLAWWSIWSSHRKRPRTPARTSPTRQVPSH
ncbi:MAG: hypothetical protein C5B44_03270 [Acidobacteria bacterium]|nr:MAG: hypothetical protein C5B44_03270 [Acidobacteriota bacterium]